MQSVEALGRIKRLATEREFFPARPSWNWGLGLCPAFGLEVSDQRSLGLKPAALRDGGTSGALRVPRPLDSGLKLDRQLSWSPARRFILQILGLACLCKHLS